MLQLKKFPDIPVSTREEARGPAHIQRSLVSTSKLEIRDSFPASSGKNSRLSRPISRRGALNRKGERNPSVVPQFQGTPRYLSPFQRNLFSLHCLYFHAEDPLTPPWHVPRGTALWEILVGKPRGKATDPLIPATGSVTLLLQFVRKAYEHAPTRDEH